MGTALDVILLLLLVGYVAHGARRGFSHGLGSILGVAVGGIAGYFLVPMVSSLIVPTLWRVLACVGVFVGLVAVGHALGAGLGDAIARRIGRTPLAVVDRVLGAVTGGIVAALVMSFLAATASPLGIPVLSTAIGQSAVLRTITQYTPEPVQSALARVRSGIVRDAIPSIVDQIGGITANPTTPDVDTDTAVLEQAAQSVLRITGSATACAQTQSGTGFVIASERVVTNAHVVAGVTEPVVETRDGAAYAATVVYFDPTGDLAVLAVPHLDESVLALADPVLGTGDEAVIDGFPYGGPFSTSAASVLALGSQQVDDIYGDSANARTIYTIAADVEEGDSGGPLLTTDGEVSGIVFAKSATTSGLGYAIALDELEPVVEEASSLTSEVTSGHCVSG
ncbi:MAG: MarP family serine protease [Microbacteriaceae bacterium]